MYTITAGDRAAFTFETHRIDEQSVLKVNVADGNLIVASNDLNVNSVGQNLVLQRTFEAAGFYSSYSGEGWSNSLTPDVSLYASGNVLTYVGNDGSPFACTLATATTWDCPGQMDAWIDKIGYGLYDLTFRHTRGGHHQGDQQVFYSDGRLAFTLSAAGQSTWLNYDTNNRVTGVTDTEGRTITYAKDASGYITGVTYPGATPGSTRTVGYGFDSIHNMTSFTDAAGQVTHYGYDSLRNLNQIIDPDGHVINIGYDTYGRVATLSYPKPGGTDTTTFTYTPGSGCLGGAAEPLAALFLS